MNAVRYIRGASRTGRLNKMSKMSRSRRMAALAGVAVTSATAVLSFGSAAFAGTGWTSAGSTGSVTENAVPAECYNIFTGYDVVAIGPSIYGFTSGSMTTEITTFTARLYDATTGTYGAWNAWAPTSYVSASHGVNYSSQRDVLPAVHGHQQYVEVYVAWYNTAGTAMVGSKAYWVSSYYNPAALGGYPMSYCSA